MKKYMNFVLTGDSNYVMPLGVTMTSILHNLNTDMIPRFFLFTTDFKEADLNKLYELKNLHICEFVNIPMEKYLHYFDKIDVSKFKLSYVNLVCYYRLLMLKILPEDVDKCFYIDGDMIIDTNLSDIYIAMTKDKIASVVVESFAMTLKDNVLSHCYQIDDFKNFKHNALKYPYFNAGFMLLNIKKAKMLKLFERAMDFLNRNPNPPYADQDTLNAIIGQCYPNDIIYLPPEYNVFCDFGINKVKWNKTSYYDHNQIIKAIKNPKIFHYAGGHKPWLDYEQNHNNIWWQYCEMSPWKNILKPQRQIKEIVSKFYIFNVFDILQISKKYKNNQVIIKVKILKVIPFIKIKLKDNRYSLLLFNFIPLITKKKEA